MDRNNHPRGTRNSRRETRKHSFSKKMAYLSIFTISLVLICGGVYATYAMQHKPKEASELENDDHYEKRSLIVRKNQKISKTRRF